MKWTSVQEEQLKTLVNGTLSYQKIAEIMLLKKNQIATKARSLGLKNPVQIKHAHLREKVFTYFLNHNVEQTQKRFSISESEFKSIFTAGYKDPKLAHLRKDKRRKDKWTLEEMLFCLKNAGIIERLEIAKRLKRSTARNIKERFQSWNASTKHLNGMPLSWVIQLWDLKPLERKRFIRTEAGPSGSEGIWRFQILPWYDCLKLSQKYPTSEVISSGIRAMVKFQEFIFQTSNFSVIRRKITQSINKSKENGNVSRTKDKRNPRELRHEGRCKEA